MGMKKDTKARVLIIKDYMEKWDWNIAPLFMLAEEDAHALLEILSLYEKNVKKKVCKIQGESRMNKRPIDRTKKSNIKCEHCKTLESGHTKMSSSRHL